MSGATAAGAGDRYTGGNYIDAPSTPYNEALSGYIDARGAEITLISTRAAA